jgi:hypothetical protein
MSIFCRGLASMFTKPGKYLGPQPRCRPTLPNPGVGVGWLLRLQENKHPCNADEANESPQKTTSIVDQGFAGPSFWLLLRIKIGNSKLVAGLEFRAIKR